MNKASLNNASLALLALLSAATAAPAAAAAQAQVPGEEARLFSVDGLDGPEAVRYDPDQDVYFVASFGEDADDPRDGNGYISRIAADDGRVESKRFMTGTADAPLHMPRGMFIRGDTLWVADVDGVHGFDRATGRHAAFVDFRAHEPGFLNDIAAGPDGLLYVTDTGRARVYRIRADGQAEVAIEDERTGPPNGITWDAARSAFLLAPWGGETTLRSWDPASGELRDVATLPGGRFDGIEVVDGGVLVASQDDQTLHLLHDDGGTRPVANVPGRPADIGVDTRRGRVAVPYIALGRVDVWALEPNASATREPAGTAVDAPPAGWDGQPLRWTPEQHMAFEGVQGTALSPDGSLVAFVRRTPLMEGEQSEWRSQVWVVPTAGGKPRQYTRHDSDASSPTFSPDGRWLAFAARRGGGDEARRQVWVMPVDGGEAFAATDAEAGVGAFRWSPSGDRIAYLMTDPETEEEKARERERRDIIYVDRDFDFAHLYWVPFDPGADEIPDATRVTDGERHITSFDWSPDGARFVVSHQPDPRLDTGSETGDLATVPASGGALRPLVTLGGVEGSPRWSPDGRWVAFVGEGDQPEPVGLGDLYVVPADGGEPRRLAETPDRSSGILGWGGDSRTLYVVESLGVDRHVLAVPVDGDAVRQVTTGEGVVGSPSLDAAGRRLAFTWEDPDTPWDLYVRPVDGGARTRLTRLHDHVDPPPMGRTETLTWTSKDGRFEIEGLLTYPVGYEPGTRVPLILSVHGGPAGVYSRSFTGGPSIYMTQYFADHGWAVLRPNPRGSTGYGQEFRYANVRDWGFGDMDDLMAGVDHVIEMGVAHPDSLLLMGWSYGGYMTSFAVTRTDRFRAASMGAGLPNLVSMVTTTDIGNYLVGHMDAEFWDDYDVYERHSAIYRIAEVETPTQVIHGAQDLRVPFTQGQEFYRALLRRGVPTEMIVLPRTPHGPREPKLLMAVSPAIQEWFARWLREER